MFFWIYHKSLLIYSSNNMKISKVCIFVVPINQFILCLYVLNSTSKSFIYIANYLAISHELLNRNYKFCESWLSLSPQQGGYDSKYGFASNGTGAPNGVTHNGQSSQPIGQEVPPYQCNPMAHSPPHSPLYGTGERFIDFDWLLYLSKWIQSISAHL